MATTAKIAKEVKKQAELDRAKAAGTPAEVPYPPAQPLQELRPSAWISPQVLSLPYLFPQVRPGRGSSWRDKGELVTHTSEPGRVCALPEKLETMKGAERK